MGNNAVWNLSFSYDKHKTLPINSKWWKWMWKPRLLSQVSLNPPLLYNSISVQATSGKARKLFLKMASFAILLSKFYLIQFWYYEKSNQIWSLTLNWVSFSVLVIQCHITSVFTLLMCQKRNLLCPFIKEIHCARCYTRMKPPQTLWTRLGESLNPLDLFRTSNKLSLMTKIWSFV